MNVYINGIDLTTAQSVLLIIPDTLMIDEIMKMKEILEREFPHCNFVLLQGDFQAVVSKQLGQHIIES